MAEACVVDMLTVGGVAVGRTRQQGSDGAGGVPSVLRGGSEGGGGMWRCGGAGRVLGPGGAAQHHGGAEPGADCRHSGCNYMFHQILRLSSSEVLLLDIL